MKLPHLSDLEVSQKKVIVRGDLDIDDVKLDNYRLESLVSTLKYLVGKDAKVILIGHRGRPEGKEDDTLSLRETTKALNDLLGIKRKFVYDLVGQEVVDAVKELSDGELLVLENLRFDTREEKNEESFSKKLASLGDFFVNEAFGNSHRKHASMVGLPKHLPHAVGLHFKKEVENLEKVKKDPERPVISVISGVKDDKMKYVEAFKDFSDKVLLGGRLPDYIHDESPLRKDEKIVVASLIADKEDLSLNAVERFETEIASAKTIIVSGPPGKFEDEGHRQGSERVLTAIAKSSAYKVAGGGNTQEALALFGLEGKFDWVSVGGGAMLEFLATGTLPGIEVLLEK